MSKVVSELDSIASGDGSKLQRLIEKNPAIEDLVNTFDLCLSNGDILPNKEVNNEYRFSLFFNGADNTKNTIPREEINLDTFQNTNDHI